MYGTYSSSTGLVGSISFQLPSTEHECDKVGCRPKYEQTPAYGMARLQGRTCMRKTTKGMINLTVKPVGGSKKGQNCTCWVVKGSWFSNEFLHKEINQKNTSGNFQ